ncbi:hypothetical protein [Streptomyces sp. 184]|uniref:hypothetical protein n=1 Tax=Streptomyces sp. 184 TaxID=1827526 RepID=UPI0038924448
MREEDLVTSESGPDALPLRFDLTERDRAHALFLAGWVATDAAPQTATGAGLIAASATAMGVQTRRPAAWTGRASRRRSSRAR